MKTLKKKILLVDDDEQLRRELTAHLQKHGYDVTAAPDGRSALQFARAEDFDLVVLDLNFPDENAPRDRSIDGIEVLRILRESGSVPVLMLSATNVSAVKVLSLTLGADDYVPKPFDMSELVARIEAILRRGGLERDEQGQLNFRRIKVDLGSRRVWKDGEEVELTGIEFEILCALARRPDHVFTRDKLMEIAWKDSVCVAKAVDVHIAHIRKKIEDVPNNPRFIVTVRGTGYRFEEERV
jgi:DNA-binding response OmpR family regulator